MIRRIFLDLDDVCNTLAPFVLHSVGYDVAPTDYGENIERFEAHGGHAILVPRPWNDNWASDPRNYLEEKLRRQV
jgi:hypothetical protein